MDIHEYQAKEQLARFGVPIPQGGLAYSPEQAVYQARQLGGSLWVVKAQIHSGARGKAGGIRVCKDIHDVWTQADDLLGSQLVTEQTGPKGKPVLRLYIEAGVNIEKEYYLSFVLDRASERIMVVSSSQGGMSIEEVAKKNPEAINRLSTEPAMGLQDFEVREIAFKLGFTSEHIAQTVQTIRGAYRAFRDLDAAMVEINPLVLTDEGQIYALDCKMSFDENGLFRHSEITELRDRSQEDSREATAADKGLSYVGLEGEVGCIINGAGLAMATMDMIKLAGSEPANFLDIGGGASPERVAEAIRLVAMDGNVKVILLNIFAGINRCDWIAKGVIQAFQEVDLKLPFVVRLAGTNVEEGQKILADSGLPIILATTLADAAEKAVAVTKA